MNNLFGKNMLFKATSPLKLICRGLALASLIWSFQSHAERPHHDGYIQGDQRSPVVSTAYGPVQGTDNGHVYAWMGIPYAEPPVGKLRWMPPQPPQPWASVKAAVKPGSTCTQGNDLGFFATPGGAEDCLYLNVYADRKAFEQASSNGKKLPVFVWFHGGALWVGQGDDHNPSALVANGKAIVVTFNYRLGIFGYFAHPSIDDEGHPAANYGTMDQTFVLQWIKKNIAAFGGDPSDVTIAGESAGGDAVIAQMLSTWAKGLFHQVIEMSGATNLLKEGNFGATVSLKTAEHTGEEFARQVGCRNDKDAAACLRALPASVILANRQGHQLVETVVDGNFLPARPEKLLETGMFNHVRLISGSNRDEGDFFAALPEVITGKALQAGDYANAIKKQFGPHLSSAVLTEYPLDNYLNASEAYAAAVGDNLFSCPSLRLKRLAARHTEVWGYEFADRTAPTYAPPVSFPVRAGHTAELPYIFSGFHGGEEGLPVHLNDQQQKLAAAMQIYWTSARHAHDWEEWPQFVAGSEKIMRFQLPKGNTVNAKIFARDHHCGFWDSQSVY
jgi:para-nitrobenzyl esterase